MKLLGERERSTVNPVEKERPVSKMFGGLGDVSPTITDLPTVFKSWSHWQMTNASWRFPIKPVFVGSELMRY